MENPKVLVIEDEIKIAGLIKRVIESEKYSVELAHDGQQGLRLAEKNKYDLIVLDIMLPKLNGLEVCRALRSDHIKTPIIVLTAKDTIEDRLAATEAGANDYLSKPFYFEDLLEKVKFLIETKNEDSEANQDTLDDEKVLEKINQKIMDNIPVSIVTIDKGGNMVSANKFFKNLSRRGDYKKNNVLTDKFFVRENLVKDYQKLLSDGTMIKRDHCFERNTNGEDKYLKIIAVPLLDKVGNIEGAVSMALDNTETVQLHKKLQLLNEELEKKVIKRTAELKKANEEIAKVMELKSMFVADVSHEMRTSLAIVQGNIELMSRGLIENDDKEETYGQVFDEIKRMSTMLADMTLLSESETSKQRLEYSKMDINQVISSVINSVRVVAKEKNIKITHKNSKANIEMMADISQIEKLLSNLIRNSIRYNKENGTVNISVKSNENEIAISVEDSGIGIPNEYLNDIFERFYRVDKARSREDGGSGLGLAICKWVAEVHKGNIKVESTVGTGSTFTVTLPRNPISKEY